MKTKIIKKTVLPRDMDMDLTFSNSYNVAVVREVSPLLYTHFTLFL